MCCCVELNMLEFIESQVFVVMSRVEHDLVNRESSVC